MWINLTNVILVWRSVLKNSNNFSLWNKGQICLQPTIMIQISLTQPIIQTYYMCRCNLALLMSPLWDVGLREVTQETDYILAIAIAVSNKVSFVSDPGVSMFSASIHGTGKLT